jgi:hypothetical protein
MGKCPAITRNGQPCRGLVGVGNDYCPAHDPARQEARSKAASKAGKSRPGRELLDIKDLCQDLADRVLSGELETGRAAVANQLINTRLRALEVERKIREQEELEERITRLEQRQGSGARREGGRWGA